MDTDRIDTDAPLNSNQQEYNEDDPYMTDQRVLSFKNQVEDDENQAKKRGQSQNPKGGKPSIDPSNSQCILQKQDQKCEYQKDSDNNDNNNECIESLSNKSNKVLKRNDESLFTRQQDMQIGEKSSQDKHKPTHQSTVSNESSDVIKQTLRQSQEQEEQTTQSHKYNKTNKHNLGNHNQNIQNNIGQAKNDQRQFDGNRFNDNQSDENHKQFQIKTINSQSSANNEQDFLEFEEIEVKTIQFPKPSTKKRVLQPAGIVRYVENSFGKKKKQSADEGSDNSKNQNSELDEKKDNDILYLSFAQNPQAELSSSELGSLHRENAKTVEKSKFGNERGDNIFLKKQSQTNSQQLCKESSLSSKDYQFQSFEKKSQKMAVSQIYQADRREKQQSTNKNKEKSQSNPDNKKFITYKKIRLVRRIIKIFEKFNVLRRFSSIPQVYFEYFGDKASWFNLQNAQNIFQKIKHNMNIKQEWTSGSVVAESEEKISKLVLFQDNKIVLFVKILVIICSVMQCIYIPMSIAFSNSFSPTQNFNIAFTIVPSIVFVIDMYINFNLAFFFKGKLISNRRQIATNYFFGQYWLDLISIVLQILMDKSLPSLVIRLFIIRKELDRVLSTFQIQEKFYYAYRLIRLAIELLLSCHILACTFILAASYSAKNWLTLNELEHENDTIKYLNSLYYIIVTMTTIGYGDIHPVSNTEKLFLCFIGFITSGLFAYNISTISSIVNDSIRKKLETKMQILSVTEYMTERQISRSVQNQVLQQLYYNIKTQRKSPKVINECLQHVSENLKGSLFNEYFGNILSTNKYFKRKFSKQFLNCLIPKFKEEVFPPGQIIFKSGELDERLIYVREGGITLYLSYSSPTPIVQEYHEGKWLGFEEFFTGEPKNCFAKSQNFTSIVYIERNDLLEVIQSFPRDKEAFCMIKDKIKFSNLPISYNCNICNSMFHQIHKCPFVHFTKKKEYIIQKYNYQLTSKREPQYMRKQVKYNSRTTNEQVRYQLKNFRMTLLLMAEGMNLFEFQGDQHDCESIFENQKRHTKHSKALLSNYAMDNNNSFVNSKETNLIYNSSQIVQNTNFGQNSNAPQDGSVISNCDSPLPRLILPESNQRNLSKFRDKMSFTQADNELPEILIEQDSPISARKTRHSFKNEEGSVVEYISEDNNKEKGNEEEQQNISEYARQEEQRAQIIFNVEMEMKKKQANKELIQFDTIESKQLQSHYIQQQKNVQIDQVRRTTFTLKPQNMNSVIKILPSNIETDYEFFLKYDGFKWENNEISVIKNEQIASMNSVSQIDGGIEQTNITPTTTTTTTTTSTTGNYSQFKYGGNNITQAQAQLIHHNLSVINEEDQKDNAEDSVCLVPMNIIQSPSNEQQILMKILNDVEQIKQQYDNIRKDASQRAKKIENNINNALQRTFTFSNTKSHHLIQEEHNGDQSARFGINGDDYSFGKKKTDLIESIKGEENKNYQELINQQERNQKQKLQQDTIQNDSNFYQSQSDKDMDDINSKLQNQIHQKQQIIESNTKLLIENNSYIQNGNKSQNEVVNQIRLVNQQTSQQQQLVQNANQDQQTQLAQRIKQQNNYDSEEINMIQNNNIPNSMGNQSNVIKSTQINQLKLKDKIEFQFFIAFERQNNWKTYFPVYNLSYITEKIKKIQKRKLKMDMIPPMKIAESTVSQNYVREKPTKFRRLSELVQENKERNTSVARDSRAPSQNKRISLAKNIFGRL